MKAISSHNLNQKTPKKKSKFVSILKGFVLITILIAVGSYLFITNKYTSGINESNTGSSEQIQFTIEEGSNIDQIFAKLVKNKVINNDKKLIFKYYLRETGLGTTIQAGVYRLPQDLNIVELVNALQNAGIHDLWITIPEGLRKDEIADILETEFNKNENAVFDKNEFLSLTINQEFISHFELPTEVLDLEGYLFPDRYLLSIEATSESVLTTLINTFFIKIDSEVTYEDMIIASIIEREAITDYDREMVSDITRRRLAEGWFLGMDTTSLYYHKDWKYELTFQDLQDDNAYNTRINVGLPPTPICNPGQSSIIASLNPKENNYYYFIADLEGNFHYAENAYQHEQNVQKYLR